MANSQGSTRTGSEDVAYKVDELWLLHHASGRTREQHNGWVDIPREWFIPFFLQLFHHWAVEVGYSSIAIYEVPGFDHRRGPCLHDRTWPMRHGLAGRVLAYTIDYAPCFTALRLIFLLGSSRSLWSSIRLLGSLRGLPLLVAPWHRPINSKTRVSFPIHGGIRSWYFYFWVPQRCPVPSARTKCIDRGVTAGISERKFI